MRIPLKIIRGSLAVVTVAIHLLNAISTIWLLNPCGWKKIMTYWSLTHTRYIYIYMYIHLYNRFLKKRTEFDLVTNFCLLSMTWSTFIDIDLRPFTWLNLLSSKDILTIKVIVQSSHRWIEFSVYNNCRLQTFVNLRIQMHVKQTFSNYLFYKTNIIKWCPWNWHSLHLGIPMECFLKYVL